MRWERDQEKEMTQSERSYKYVNSWEHQADMETLRIFLTNQVCVRIRTVSSEAGDVRKGEIDRP